MFYSQLFWRLLLFLLLIPINTYSIHSNFINTLQIVIIFVFCCFFSLSVIVLCYHWFCIRLLALSGFCSFWEYSYRICFVLLLFVFYSTNVCFWFVNIINNCICIRSCHCCIHASLVRIFCFFSSVVYYSLFICSFSFCLFSFHSLF